MPKSTYYAQNYASIIYQGLIRSSTSSSFFPGKGLGGGVGRRGMGRRVVKRRGMGRRGVERRGVGRRGVEKRGVGRKGKRREWEWRGSERLHGRWWNERAGNKRGEQEVNRWERRVWEGRRELEILESLHCRSLPFLYDESWKFYSVSVQPNIKA